RPEAACMAAQAHAPAGCAARNLATRSPYLPGWHGWYRRLPNALLRSGHAEQQDHMREKSRHLLQILKHHTIVHIPGFCGRRREHEATRHDLCWFSFSRRADHVLFLQERGYFNAKCPFEKGKRFFSRGKQRGEEFG